VKHAVFPTFPRITFQVGTDSRQLHPAEPIPFEPIEFIITDSGPQVSLTVSCLLEYGLPIVLWLIILFLIRPEFNEYVKLTTLMWILHFTKRVLEVLFVHSFSMATRPLFLIKGSSAFKSCVYYWAFAGAMALNTVWVADRHNTSGQREVALSIWCISELLNGYCHLALKKLRPKGSREYFCPKGFLFDNIVAPNYTFEILAWVGFALYSQTVVSVVFPIVGGIQMFLWADEKRKKLALQFPVVESRGRILPFF
jgi:very-long-chain enoyl-CoA reductase